MKKIKLSRSQWEAAGVKAGWMKQAQTEWTNLDMMHTDQEIIQHYLELARSSNGAYVDCSKAPSHLRRQIEQLVAEEQDKMSQQPSDVITGTMPPQPTGFQTPASGKATVKTAQGLGWKENPQKEGLDANRGVYVAGDIDKLATMIDSAAGRPTDSGFGFLLQRITDIMSMEAQKHPELTATFKQAQAAVDNAETVVRQGGKGFEQVVAKLRQSAQLLRNPVPAAKAASAGGDSKATVKTAQAASADSNAKGTVSTHGQISDIISALVSNPHLCTMFLQRVFQDSRCQSVAFDIINSEPAILARLPDASAKSKADLQKVAQTPAPQQQQAPQPAPQQPAAKPGYAGLTYGGIVAKNPSIGKMVDWLRAALAYKFKGAMKPDQEKQLRAQQTNLRVALDKMGIQWKQFPEILEVLST